MITAEAKFGEYLRSKGLKYTPERRAILRGIFTLHRHFDVEMLYELLKKRGERISLATLYRLLPLLLESGMIKQATRCDGRVTYEHIFGHRPHHHLVCVSCGRVIEFYDRKMEERLKEICAGHDFTPLDHRLGVRGLCADCRQDKPV